MEEILASIRRIIADDNPEGGKPQVAAAPAPQPKPVAPAASPKSAMSQDDIDAMLADQASDEDDGVLELVDPVSPPRIEPVTSPAFRQVPASDVVFREEPGGEMASSAPDFDPAPALPAERLLSAETNAAVSAAFGSLATTILSENSRTIEDLVREMLRPMLKAWLDDNLPGLVERMVRAEIERVSRGGR